MGALSGKVALITGASRGQGEAEARLFAGEGARVVLADVLDEEGRQVAKDIGDAAHYEHLDVGSPEDWGAAVAATRFRFGALHVLVNNAGSLRQSSIEETPLEVYMEVVRVNQLGCWLGMQAALGPMRDSGGGSIVNVSSVAGLQGIRGGGAYVASKFAVRGMTKVAAIEFGAYGIRVNSVHPGMVATAMLGMSPDAIPAEGPWSAWPISRPGLPVDVAHLVAFLASDASGYCTGAEFTVDGGLMAGQSRG